MRRLVLACLVLTGCGGSPPAPAEAGPWTVRAEPRRAPLACPASSSRAGWPSRVLRLAGGTTVKLWGRRPRLAEVDAGGSLLRQTELGARAPADVRALACGRADRVAVAWSERRGERGARLRLWLGRDALTLDTVSAPYDDPPISDVALAFRADGTLVVAYAVHHAVRVVRVSSDGEPGAPRRLGPAFESTAVVAERDVVAWTTIDTGEERNERRRVYAVRGGARAQLVARAPRVVDTMTGLPGATVRLAVAANGRAALLWGLEREEYGETTSLHAAVASRRGRFGRARRIADEGVPGDIAIDASGVSLAVFSVQHELFARLRFEPAERIAEDAPAPSASFVDGHPRVEWRGGVGERR